MTHDIHVEAAAKLFNVPVNSVTPQQRRAGKAYNYSIQYSAGKEAAKAYALQVYKDTTQ